MGGVIPPAALNVNFNAGRVEIMFHHKTLTMEWTPVCGYDSFHSYDTVWQTDECLTEHLMMNVTRCICPLSGSYVVLLERQNFNVRMSEYFRPCV